MFDLFCPECEPVKIKSGAQIGPHLLIIEKNYSGTGTDRVRCQQCKTIFIVSYKVDQIIKAINQ